MDENINNTHESQNQSMVLCQTKLSMLNDRYYFHEKIKETDSSAHYIVEDLSEESNYYEDEDQIFFYLKQQFFKNYEDFVTAKNYYVKLFNYTGKKFCKKEMILISQIFDFVDRQTNYFELVILFKYGETDRIDIEKIENQHINQFLYNICNLLHDVKEKTGQTHNNILIKNIVLIDRDLKLSGFKPLFLNDRKKKSWKKELAREFSSFRMDLYTIGLLWLKFFNIQLDHLVENSFSLQKVRDNIDSLLFSLPDHTKSELIIQLLDLTNHPNLTIEQILLQFNENYIIENLQKDQHVRKQSTPESVAVEKNLFSSPFRDSEANLLQFNKVDKNSIIEGDQFRFYGQEITLKNPSVTPEEERKQIQDLISIKDQEEEGEDYKFEYYKDVKQTGNRRSVDPYIHKEASINRVQSDNQLSTLVKSNLNPFKKIRDQIRTRQQSPSLFQKGSNQEQIPLEHQIPVLNGSPSFQMSTFPLNQSKGKFLQLKSGEEKIMQIHDQQDKVEDQELIKHSIREILGILESKRTVPQNLEEPKPEEIINTKQETVIKEKKLEEAKKEEKKTTNAESKSTKKKSPKTNDHSKKSNSNQPKCKNEILKDLYKEMKQEIKGEKQNRLNQVMSQKKIQSNKQMPRFNSSLKTLKSQEVQPAQKIDVFEKQQDFTVVDEKKTDQEIQATKPIEKASVNQVNQNSLISEDRHKNSLKKIEESRQDSLSQKRPEVSKSIEKPSVKLVKQSTLNSEDRLASTLNKIEEESCKDSLSSKQSEKYEVKPAPQKEKPKPLSQKQLEVKKPDIPKRDLGEEFFLQDKKQMQIFSKKYIDPSLSESESIEDKQKEREESEDKKLQLPVSQRSIPRKSLALKSQSKERNEDRSKRRSMHIQKIEELLPSSEQHNKNRVYNKNNLSGKVLMPTEEHEEKTIDEKIQELILKKLVNKSVSSGKEFKYQKLMLCEETKEQVHLPEKLKSRKQKRTAEIQSHHDVLQRDEKVDKSKNKLTKKYSERKLKLGKSSKYKNIIIKNYESFNHDPTYQKLLFKKTLLSTKKTNDKDLSQNISQKQKIFEETQKSQSIGRVQSQQHQNSFKQISEMVKQVQKQDNENAKRQKNEDQTPQSRKNSINMIKKSEKNISKEIVTPITQKQPSSQEPYQVKYEKQNIKGKYQENIQRFNALLKENKLVHALQLLDLIIESESGDNKIKTLNILSDFYSQNNHVDKALMTLNSTINFIIKEESDLVETHLHKLLFKRALIFQKLQRIYEASKDLSNRIFKEEKNQPPNYWTIFGDCLYKEQKYQEAFQCYKKQLEKQYDQIYDQKAIDFIVIHFNKAFLCLIDANDLSGFETFLEQVLKKSSQIKGTVEDLKTEGILQIEVVILNALIICSFKKNSEILYLITTAFLNQGLIDFKLLNNQQQEKLFEILFDLMHFIKTKTQLKEQKKVYPKLLDYLVELNKQFPQSQSSLKRTIMILFNQGIRLVQENQIDLSKSKFDECIEIYKNNLGGVDKEILNIMFELGEKVEKMNLLEFSVYFYEKINDSCQEPEMKIRTAIKLSLIHFKLAEFQTSLSYIQPHILDFFEEKTFLEKIFIIVIYFLNCVRLHDTQYKKTLLELDQFLKKNQGIQFHHFGLLINKIFSSQFFRKNANFNQDFQTKLGKIMKIKKLKNFPAKFIGLFEELYDHIIVQKKGTQAQMFPCLKNVQISKEENSLFIKEYLKIFYFIMDFGTKFAIEIKGQDSKMKMLFQNLEFLDSSKLMSQALEWKVVQTIPAKKNRHSFDKVNVFQKQSQSARQIKSETPEKKKESSSKVIKTPEEPAKIWEHELVMNPPKIEESNQCICWAFNTENKLLVQEIHSFLQQIKKHMYNDNEIDFHGFFPSFEKHLQVMDLQLKKYEYLKKVIQFWNSQKELNFFNEVKYFQVFEEIFQNKEICEHDVKNMFTLQEAFLDARYSFAFIKVLEKSFPNSFQDIYEEHIIGNLFKKYEKYQQKILKVVESPKRLNITQNPFFKFFLGERIEKLLKPKISQRHYKKFRYDFYDNPKLDKKFQELFGDDYVEYLLKLNTVKTINELLFYKTSSYKVMKIYIDRLMSILVNQSFAAKLIENLLIDLYMIMNLVNFSNDPQNLEELILQAIFLMKEKIGENTEYLFCLVVNRIGNIFYSEGKNMMCNKLKSIAFETLKEISCVRKLMSYPDFVIQSPEESLFDIFSYFYIIQIEQNQKELAAKCLNKLQSFTLDNQFKKNIQKLLEFYHMYKLAQHDELNIQLKNYESWKELPDGSLERSVICYIRMGIYGLNEDIFEEIQEKGVAKLLEILETQ